MASPTDIRINVYLETEDGHIHAPEGPGWYLDVRYNEGKSEVAPRTRLTVKNIEELAMTLDSILQGKKPNFSEGVPQNQQSILSVVKAASAVAKQSIVSALRSAEEAAARAAELRRRISEFDDG